MENDNLDVVEKNQEFIEKSTKTLKNLEKLLDIANSLDDKEE